jgi:hypothetical protein
MTSYGRREKNCSSMDSNWYHHFCFKSHHILQLMMQDHDLMCSTLRTWNQVWLGMYNLTKWLGEAKSWGIQMSPILGVLLCLSGIEDYILCKVWSEVILPL